MRTLLILIGTTLSVQVFSQEYTWEIKEAEKNGSIVEITFFMYPKFEDPKNGMTSEFTLKIDKGFIKNKIYPNLPKGIAKNLKSLKGLFFEKDPHEWNHDSNIYPYKPREN